MTARAPIPRRQGDGPAPLSFAQRRLWFVQQLAPERAGASTPLALRLDGPLDVAALQTALDAVVARHDALRTRVAAGGTEPQQVVDPSARLALAVEPLDDGGGDAVAARVAAEARRPFDLARAPLARATLLALAPETHVLLLVAHHVVFDAWSRGIVRRELAAAYGAAVRGDAWAPPAPPIRFADYATWQRGGDAEAARAADEAYWLAELAGAPLALPLPHECPHVAPGTVGAASAVLPAALADAVRALARREGTAPFTVLLAAYQVAVARLVRRDDFVVGVVVSGRTRAETEGVVGCFVNTLPVRARTEGDPTPRALLARVRAAWARALAHQQAPFERLVERLNPAREAGGAPLVQAAFNFRNVPSGGAEMPGLRVSPLPPAPESATPGVALSVDDGADGLHCALAYDAARLSPSTADALLADFRLLLEAAVATPDLPLSALPAPPARPAPAPAAGDGADPPREFDALLARSNLTATQLLIWLHAQRHPDLPLYNLASLRVWEEAVDPAAFGRAFAALVARSEALRATVAERDGVPRQTVHAPDSPEAAPVLEVLDLSGQADPLAAARAWAAARVATPLDLTRRSYDAVLLRLGPARTAWYLGSHHAVTDGWLRALLHRELYADYQAERAGAPAPARPTPPRHADAVVAAERALLAAAGAPAHVEPDDGEPPRPYGRPPRGGVGRVHRTSVLLGAERTARLRDLAERPQPHARTPDVAAANLCAAAVCAVLHRVGGGTRVRLGVPVHNRRTEAARAAHGLAMRALTVSVAVRDEDRLDELARAVAEATRAEGARPPAGAAADGPGVDAVFNYHPPVRARVPERWIDWPHPGWAAEPLAVGVRDYLGAGALTLDVDAREDVYDAETRALLVRHLLAALDAVLADPATRVGDVALLTAEERRLVVVPPEATAAPLPDAATVVDLIAAQSRATPDAVAVTQPAPGGAGPTLTYAALQAEAERIARALRRRGVGRGDCVGLLLHRSPSLVAAMLGVMRAGAAYVPLDPAYPAARLALMARDARLALCLADPALRDRLPTDAAPAVTLDALDGAPGELPSAPTRDDLAYVLYTSGSTGTPKGVEVPHVALLNFVADSARRFALAPGDRFLQFNSPSFDTAVEEIFPTLARGAAVVLRDDGWLDSMAAFVTRCEESGVTIFSLPTAFWHELAEALGRGAVALPARVRLAAVGGERMRADRLAEWRCAVGGRVALWNGYGPTETTVVSHFADLTRAPDGPASADVSIGAPITNAYACVLDARRRPVPVGVPGELYVGGLGLARGYRGQPALTAERFVDDPFVPGGRLYRTGDLVRVRPDGALEVLGRADPQAKIRGFRVEPGEVEAALLAVSGVRDGAVAVRDDGAGPRLVAYVVPADGGAPSVREAVDAALRRQLPEHMLPSALVVLAALPLTPSGKVDRRALPAPDAADAGAGAYVAPRTPVERAIAAVWAELLAVPRVGVDDDFFRLGGHSLLAVRVMGRVREATGAELPLRALFEARTVAGLALAVTAHAARAAAPAGDDAALDALLAELEALPDDEAARAFADLGDSPGRAS